MYGLFRRLLFSLPTETSHHLALASLKVAERLRLLSCIANVPTCSPRQVMGIDFPNPVGLAAGLDKNGEYIDALAALGFGFIEIGTITPKPQPGNPAPRLFRLPEATAIINRMGFNNKGVDYLVEQVKKSQFKGVLGINIGKNKDTPAEQAVNDYLICMQKVYAYASYITVNLSSPNTPGLRDLQFGDPLDQLLARLKEEQQLLAKQYGRYVPLTVKIAPDMADDDIIAVAQSLLKYQLDGVIATNTTIARDRVRHLPHGEEMGGLSGAPLTEDATQVISKLVDALEGKIPVIGVGGIVDEQSAKDKFAAGADLVQIYSGFIYKGPALIKAVVKACQ